MVSMFFKIVYILFRVNHKYYLVLMRNFYVNNLKKTTLPLVKLTPFLGGLMFEIQLKYSSCKGVLRAWYEVRREERGKISIS